MKKFVIIPFFLLLVSCATHYKPRGMWGNGYSHYRVDTEHFVVTFRGNRYTNEEEVKRFALLRASELTLNHGFKYFVVVQEKDLSKAATEKTHGEYWDRVEEVKYPAIELTIICLLDKKEDQKAIDATSFISYNRNSRN